MQALMLTRNDLNAATNVLLEAVPLTPKEVITRFLLTKILAIAFFHTS
jgi:hypothetical protein